MPPRRMEADFGSDDDFISDDDDYHEDKGKKSKGKVSGKKGDKGKGKQSEVLRLH